MGEKVVCILEKMIPISLSLKILSIEVIGQYVATPRFNKNPVVHRDDSDL